MGVSRKGKSRECQPARVRSDGSQSAAKRSNGRCGVEGRRGSDRDSDRTGQPGKARVLGAGAPGTLFHGRIRPSGMGKRRTLAETGESGFGRGVPLADGTTNIPTSQTPQALCHKELRFWWSHHQSRQSCPGYPPCRGAGDYAANLCSGLESRRLPAKQGSLCRHDTYSGQSCPTAILPNLRNAWNHSGYLEPALVSCTTRTRDWPAHRTGFTILESPDPHHLRSHCSCRDDTHEDQARTPMMPSGIHSVSARHVFRVIPPHSLLPPATAAPGTTCPSGIPPAAACVVTTREFPPGSPE